jgi:glycosyltransferase involved in cell wall biosynthesis
VAHPIYSSFGEPLERNDARAQLGITEERVILFFGYIRRYKGLHVLLEAFARLPQIRPTRLLVVGEYYDDASDYQKQIEQLDIADRVTVVGRYVPNDEVRVFFSAADAVVLPYLSATQSGIAQIAFHFETPVIYTDVGGLGETVRDGVHGMVVPPDDPAALTGAITSFYEQDLRQTYSANIRRDKHLFGWDNLVGAIEDLSEGR